MTRSLRPIETVRSATITDAAAELASALLQQFGECRLRVSGTSMRPSIRPGDTVLVRSVEPARVAAGEVVLFAREGRLFAHRVVETRAASRVFLTRGDAHSHLDPPVAASMLLGRVEGLFRNGLAVSLGSARSNDPAPAPFLQRLLARIAVYR